MATVLGTVQLGSYANYQLAYDLISQNTANNSSTVRFYGILNVTGYISWSSGSASVHTSGLQGIGTYYGAGSHTLITRDFTFGHDSNGNFSAWIGASIKTTYVSGDTGGTLTLPKINRIAKINSFTIGTTDGNYDFEKEMSVSYTKYVNNYNYKLRISIPSVVALETFTYNTSNNKFTLTDDTINYLYEYTKNKKTVVLGAVIETYNGNTKLGESSELKLTCTVSDCQPIFTIDNVSYEDVNSDVIAITENNQHIVQNKSNLKVIYTPAISKKGATISKYSFGLVSSNNL